MRHHKKGRSFGRERKVRVALLRSLARSLIEHEKITTTEAKAKELRPFIERLVSYGKTGTLSKHRLIVEKLGGPYTASKVMTVALKYKDRRGGYTRIVKLPRRKSDGSSMALIEFV